MAKQKQRASSQRTKWVIAVVIAAVCLMISMGCFHSEVEGSSISSSKTSHQEVASVSRKLVGSTPKPTRPTKTLTPSNPPAATPSHTTPKPATAPAATPSPTTPKLTTAPVATPATTPTATTPKPVSTSTQSPSTKPTVKPEATSIAPIGTQPPTPTPTKSSPTTLPGSTTTPTGTLKVTTRPSNATSTSAPITSTARTSNATSTPAPSTMPPTAPATVKPSVTSNANVTTKPPKSTNSTTGSVLGNSTTTPIPTASLGTGTGTGTSTNGTTATTRPVNGTTIPTNSTGNSTGQFFFRRKMPTDCKSKCDTTVVVYSCYDKVSNTFVSDESCKGVQLTPKQNELKGKRVPCGRNLCGTQGCTKTRRELRAAVQKATRPPGDGEVNAGTSSKRQKTEIRYSLCPLQGYYGQIESSNVKPTGAIGTKSPVKDAPECAKKCLIEPSCQWFMVTDSQCELFKDAAFDGIDHDGDVEMGEADEDIDMTKAMGFLLAASPDHLNRKMACAEKKQMVDDEGQRPPLILCKTAAGMSILPDPVNECGAGPWTLYRAYITKGVVTRSTKTINYQEFNDAFGEPEKYQAILTNQNSVVSIKTKKFVTNGGDITTWKFHYDQHGRVDTVTGDVTSDNMVKGYRDDTFQNKYNEVHHLADTRATGLVFNAGHVIGNQFTNPNSFWNFVPQAEKSNKSPGCWWNAETQIGKFLSMGCKATMTVRLNYFDVADLKQIGQVANSKLMAAKAEGLLNVVPSTTVASSATASADGSNDGGSSNVALMQVKVGQVYDPARAGNDAVTYPCNYFYRPFSMNLDFVISGADAGSHCSKALHVLDNGRILSVGADDTVQITRVMAHWAINGKTSNMRSIMGLATNAAGKCLAETGGIFDKLVFSKAFIKAFLVHVKSGKCVSGDGVAPPKLEVCDVTSATQLWTADAQGTLDRYANSKFVYTKADISYPSKSPFKMDELVVGAVNVGSTVLALTDGQTAASSELAVVYDFTQFKK